MDNITQWAQELYDTCRVGHYSYGDQREIYENFLIDFLKDIPKDILIYDIGCGSGYCAQLYIKRGFQKEKIYCVDFSPQNIAFLKQQGFHASVGDILDLNEIADGSADVVICNGVLHHNSDPLKGFW
ncbi:MAG: class I SAM-dependent methyltransferase [Candidatus Omnitrophica bacterium]|nr:class I SAM-dependent methyltransferase [Candidatus Omnitrophota bacterium]